MAPMFSVVIPFHNAATFVERAINSVLSQNQPALEVLLVDDASTDGSIEMIKSKYPIREGISRSQLASDLNTPLVLLSSAIRNGPGLARNLGISTAKGDWVAFLDADDFWYPDHLEELANLITRFPGVPLVATSFKEMIGASELLPIVAHSEMEIDRRRIDFFEEVGAGRRPVTSSTAAAKRSTLLAEGGFGPWMIGEDLELWTRIALKYPLATSSKVTALYIRHQLGAMAQAKSDRDRLMRASRMEEISPSAHLVVDALQKTSITSERRSFLHFLDGLRTSAVKRLLLLGEVNKAKEIAGFPLPKRGTLVFFVRISPAILLRWGVTLWNRTRSIRILIGKCSQRH